MSKRESFDFHAAGADLSIFAPKNVLDTLEPMLAHVERRWTGTAPPLRIDVSLSGDVWHVGGSTPKSIKALDGMSALPRVAGTTISSALIELAHHRGLDLWRAAVVERDGHALALVGDDWESGITLTTHLHTRGWRIVAGDYALVSHDGFIVHPFRKSLHANSSNIASFPLWYRPAIEASPWYSTARMIAFYAIDPTLVAGAADWGESAPIRAVVKVDGHVGDSPALESAEDFALGERLRTSDVADGGVAVANLILGDFYETCDFLERWFLSLPARRSAAC